MFGLQGRPGTAYKTSSNVGWSPWRAVHHIWHIYIIASGVINIVDSIVEQNSPLTIIGLWLKATMSTKTDEKKIWLKPLPYWCIWVALHWNNAFHLIKIW